MLMAASRLLKPIRIGTRAVRWVERKTLGKPGTVQEGVWRRIFRRD